MELAEERQRNADLEDAIVELGELYAEQDDALSDVDAALIELAEMIAE